MDSFSAICSAASSVRAHGRQRRRPADTGPAQPRLLLCSADRTCRPVRMQSAGHQSKAVSVSYLSLLRPVVAQALNRFEPSKLAPPPDQTRGTHLI
jgi:hypothetical protein